MIGRPLIRLDSVDSTQRVVFDLASRGAGEGTTVRAGYQTGGRGRAGRAWSVPPGEALLFSLLLQPDLPPWRLGTLSLLVGDALASVLEQRLGLMPAIKWPNDVLLGGRKVAGILIQTRPVPESTRTNVVVGVGVNVSSDRAALPDGATSLVAELDRLVDDERLLVDLLDAIDSRYRDLLRGDDGNALARVNERLWLKNEQVSIEDAGQMHAGRLTGIDEVGALMLETASGPMRIVSGELTRGPRPR